MYYISNSKSMNRVYINIRELIKKDELIAMQFYGIHYEGLLLKDAPAKEPTWPSTESHNIFHPSVDKKICLICNKLSYTEEPTIYCYLYHLQVHCEDGILCWKYQENIDIDSIEDNENINYYYPICIDTLISFHKGTREEYNIDSLLNCLCSFNIEGVKIKCEEEIEILSIVLSEALGK